MPDLTPAEKAVAEVLARCLIAPVSPGVVNAAVAAARPHIAVEVLGDAADEAHETARTYDGRTQVGRAAHAVAGVVLDHWHHAGIAARRARRA